MAYEIEIPRSRLFAMAVEDFVRRHQNRKLLEAINAAHSELPDKEERALQKKIRDKQCELVQNE